MYGSNRQNRGRRGCKLETKAVVYQLPINLEEEKETIPVASAVFQSTSPQRSLHFHWASCKYYLMSASIGIDTQEETEGGNSFFVFFFIFLSGSSWSVLVKRPTSIKLNAPRWPFMFSNLMNLGDAIWVILRLDKAAPEPQKTLKHFTMFSPDWVALPVLYKLTMTYKINGLHL